MLLLCIVYLTGCGGMQSVLDPAGKEASTLAELFWVLFAGAVVLWLLVNGLFFYVTRLNTRSMSRRLAEALIIGGGIVFPTVVLAGLLSYGLMMMPEQREAGDDLVLKVTGEQWWWRVEYWPKGADQPIVSANEIRLPLNQRTEVKLTAAKVIHSFWIPALAGKMDMFPLRETRLALEPQRVGTFRGQCAEFCGESHARMAFKAVVMPEDEFDAWLEQQAAPAQPPADELAERGLAVFQAQGCGACHTVRGTPASGRVGPDLTHVGGRETLAAGTLPVTQDAFVRWLSETKHIKPGVKMPSYDMLSREELNALGHYLEGLR
ncbi:MAG: cytochrome c oxidase subunit II [unclassified Hahellaceae]|nr:cytochrome c oxidase subunit II [Hahellaceae bacterium]|tara:strand:+ start:7158 stop:8120 length:963 start_codon:yes stop_codon:yes gene_type:complete